MLKDLLTESRSIRSFKAGEAISADTLTELVALTRLCPAAMNLQVLKYRLVYKKDECAALLKETRWASSLSQKLPPEGREPSGYIVLCHDTTIAPQKPIFSIDVGIAAQTIMLGAREKGFGGCIIGSASEERLSALLKLPTHLIPVLVLGLGVPDETVVLTDAENGSVKYHRDENNVHYVPKRLLEELIVS
ncbi:MAG: nitroreductase family protein [Ruminococcaceae bacterium]|nr:nitroreductase family protein [Oscillospiraceae bacterium]